MASDTLSGEQRDFSLGCDVSQLVGLLGAARQFLAERGLSEKTLFTVELALEEVITNIIKYADLDRGTGKIAVHLELARELVLLAVEDDGREFDPLQAKEPDVDQQIEERLPGGLGLCLVRRMVRWLRYERRGTINRLEIGIDRLSTS
jgi:serine/threonine-protein kinase RsbW